MKVELTQDKTDLIEKIIKNDRKFSGNEDLYDDFFNETSKRSLLIVESVTTPNILEAYLRRIASTAILNVLKDEGRLRRTAEGFTKVETVPVSDGAQIEYRNEYADIQISYEPIDIKDTPEDAFIKKEILQSIINAVYDVDCKNPEKQYLKLFNYRFENGLTQREIAQEMGISQSEVSKRLFKLMDEVKKTFR